MKAMRNLLQCLACLLVVAGCASGGGDKPDEERERARLLTEKQLYQRVQTLLDDEFYDLAVKNLQLLESRFPFGAYADQAQLEIIYAYYQNADRDAAVAAAERFLRLHLDHPDADYAGYMMGLANYSLKPGFCRVFTSTITLPETSSRRDSRFVILQSFYAATPTVPTRPMRVCA